MFGAIRRAFLARGYLKITMSELAIECGLTRRALYHHFSSKEDAFRAQLVWRHLREADDAIAAASQILCDGGSGIDVVIGAMNAGLGATQREFAISPKMLEFSNVVSRCCLDIVFEATANFKSRLANLLCELESRGMLFLKRERSTELVADMLLSAIRGVNNSLPSCAVEELEMRYRHMCEAILFGSASRTLEMGAISRPQALELAAQ